MPMLDTRPPPVNVLYRSGNAQSVVFQWPAGTLAGRTFTATLNGVSLGLGIVGDNMTVTATDAQTLAFPKQADFLLTETTGGASDVVIVGDWHHSDTPSAGQALTINVTQNGVTVTVSVSGQAEMTAHIARRVIDSAVGGVHGVVEHRWAKDGWGDFAEKLMTNDTPQSFTRSVNGDYGRLTGSQAGFGNHRTLQIHGQMVATDAEMTVLLKGPNVFGSGSPKPQMGLALRYQLIGGFHVAFAVWYDIVIEAPQLVNVSGWRADGGLSSLTQATGGQVTVPVARDVQVHSKLRSTAFGLWLNEHLIQPVQGHGLAAADLIAIDVDDATFDLASVAVNGIDATRGIVQVIDPTHTGAVSLAPSTGFISHVDKAKRYFPYWLKARLVGNTLSVKAWRVRDPEPTDWQLVQLVTTDGDFPTLPSGPGGFGLIAAHAHTSAYAEFGDITFRKLA